MYVYMYVYMYMCICILVGMTTFTEELYKLKRQFFEIFEYGGMRLKTDHFKLGVSLEHFSNAPCSLKVLSYWDISCV